MTRISGTWMRKSDPKEVIASIWPKLEEFLAEQGYTFFFDFPSSLGYRPSPKDMFSGAIKVYDSIDLDKISNLEGEIKKIELDLVESRAKFLRKMERFATKEGYQKFDFPLDMYGVSYIEINPLKFIYRNARNGGIDFEILPGKGFPKYEGDDLYAPKFKEMIKQETDASNLVIRVDDTYVLDVVLAGIKREYRRFRDKLWRK